MLTASKNMDFLEAAQLRRVFKLQELANQKDSKLVFIRVQRYGYPVFQS